ncbi:MAG: patatin-like phospholipase family protein [Deltaproteobacteria bacterium]|nr:patatin-like phospholipase family protein [Candidatus Zymogenaceae bacterium]
MTVEKRLKRFSEYLSLGKRKRVGLALGSGAARGLTHLGVISVLKRIGVEIACISGTSIGALVGAFFAAGKIDELDKIAAGLSFRESLKLIDPVIPRSGLIEGKRIETFLRTHLGDVAVQELPIPFACVAADFRTGAEVVLDTGDLVRSVRASISIPGIFRPVHHRDMFLVDGGIVNPVPVEVVRRLGAEFIIAVDICPRLPETCLVTSHLMDPGINKGAAEPPEPPESGPHETDDRLSAQASKPATFPTVFEIIDTSIGVMESIISRDRLAAEKPDVIITPNLDELGRFDFHKHEVGVREGSRAAWAALSEFDHLARSSGDNPAD